MRAGGCTGAFAYSNLSFEPNGEASTGELAAPARANPGLGEWRSHIAGA